MDKKRDEKLINELGLLLSAESDLMPDEAKDEVRKVFASVDSEQGEKGGDE